MFHSRPCTALVVLLACLLQGQAAARGEHSGTRTLLAGGFYDRLWRNLRGGKTVGIPPPPVSLFIPIRRNQSDTTAGAEAPVLPVDQVTRAGQGKTATAPKGYAPAASTPVGSAKSDNKPLVGEPVPAQTQLKSKGKDASNSAPDPIATVGSLPVQQSKTAGAAPAKAAAVPDSGQGTGAWKSKGKTVSISEGKGTLTAESKGKTVNISEGKGTGAAESKGKTVNISEGAFQKAEAAKSSGEGKKEVSTKGGAEAEGAEKGAARALGKASKAAAAVVEGEGKRGMASKGGELAVSSKALMSAGKAGSKWKGFGKDRIKGKGKGKGKGKKKKSGGKKAKQDKTVQ